MVIARLQGDDRSAAAGTPSRRRQRIEFCVSLALAAVIALANSSDEQIDRLIVIPHYQMVGSKILWPDLGLSRMVNITPSAGDRPDRQDSATAEPASGNCVFCFRSSMHESWVEFFRSG